MFTSYYRLQRLSRHKLRINLWKNVALLIDVLTLKKFIFWYSIQTNGHHFYFKKRFFFMFYIIYISYLNNDQINFSLLSDGK